jgi:DNA-binding transcriptional ArsR family regulator
MPKSSNGFPELNRTIHEPARLAIMTVLAACDSADFLFLQTATGLTKGNLSVQLTRLEEANLIHIERTIAHKKTRTVVSLASFGRKEMQSYWRTMDKIRTHEPAT